MLLYPNTVQPEAWDDSMILKVCVLCTALTQLEGDGDILPVCDVTGL